MTEAMTKMRKLLLLRHAKSSWDDVALADFDRPLNGRGRKDAKRLGKFMAGHGLRPALALVSAALRTRSTWELMEPRMEGVPVSFEPDLYEASARTLTNRLRRVDDHIASVLLIGHNPGIGRLAEDLVGHHGAPELLERLAEKYPTGTLTEIELDIAHWGEVEDGRGRLISFTRPRDLLPASGDGDSDL